MKKVKGFRFRVSGSLGRRLGILGLSLSTLFASWGYGQQLRYSIKQGDVIDYDYTISANPVIEDEVAVPKMVYKYRISVDSAANDSFWLTFQLRGLYTGGIWIYGNEQAIDATQTWSQNAELIHKMCSFEADHPIRYKMDTQGHILEMPGMDTLLPALHRFANENPEIKELSYPAYQVRFSKEYYTLLIQEFFPVIPSQPRDSVSLVYDTKRISVITLWERDINIPVGSSQIQLSRMYTFQNKEKHDSGQQRPMTLSWNALTGMPDSITHLGIPPEVLVYFLTSAMEFDKRTAYQIKTKMILLNSENQGRVVIQGRFTNYGQQEIRVSLPGRRILDPVVPVIVSPDGTFRIEQHMNIPTGISRIYYAKQGAYVWVSPANPNMINVFIRPGDSVNLSMDLNDPSSLRFEGANSFDQQLLNQLSRDFPPRDPSKSIRTTAQNILTIQENRDQLSQDFLRFMEVENRYTLLSHQAEIFSRAGENRLEQDPRIVLPRLSRELNNPDGYKSMAYKEFICDLMQSYYDTRITQIFGSDEDARERITLTNTVLSGWDLYWFLAQNALNQLGTFPAHYYDFLYQNFRKSYPGTDFEIELTQRYKSTENGRIGAMVPDLNVLDQNGNNRSLHKLGGQHWCLFNLYSYREIKEFVTHWIPSFQKKCTIPFTYIASTHQCTQAEIDTLVGLCKEKPVTLVMAPDSTFIRYVESLPPRVVFVDSNNAIAYHLGLWGVVVPAYLQWPDPPAIKVRSKTINLTVFWYSLGGAFVVAILLILSIRIRAHRRESKLNLKRRMAQLEVDAVRSRMNPHFLFNALSSIQNLINRNQIEEANLYLARFGELVRTILSQSSKPAIGLNEEIEMIRNYLQLEQLRFPFSFDIQVGLDVDTYAIEVPPLLIQPHVENAVMHGVSGLGKEGRIAVIFQNEGHHLVCEVKDNGPGYHPETKSGNGGLGQGWKLTRQRIELMKEQSGEDVSVEVTSGIASGEAMSVFSGTTVTFRLPIQQTS
jgi:hypothetical protein